MALGPASNSVVQATNVLRSPLNNKVSPMDTSVERRGAVVERLHADRLDALLAFGSGFHSFLEPNAVFVLSGVKPMSDAAVIVRRDGRATTVVTPAWDAPRAAAMSTTDETLGTDDLVATVGELLANDKIAADALVTDGMALLALPLAGRFGALLAGKAVASETLVRTIARCRSPREIARAEQATSIAEQGYERLLQVARPGVREYELAADIYCHMKALGGDDNFLLMSASQHNLAVRAAGGRVLEAGDMILAEITPSFEGQFVQICRTVAIGSAPPGYDDKYAILQESMRRGQGAAVPGATIAEVTEIMNQPLREAGYGDYCRPPYMRVRGHGLGMTSNLPGDVSATNQTILEEGMMFVMHPNQYLPETGYMMCGEPVVVTPGGARALSTRTATPDRIAP